MPVPTHAPRQRANAIGMLVEGERLWKILVIVASHSPIASLVSDVPKNAINTATVSTSALIVQALVRTIAIHSDHRYVANAMPGDFGCRAFYIVD